MSRLYPPKHAAGNGDTHLLTGSDPLTGLVTSTDASVTIDTSGASFDLSVSGSGGFSVVCEEAVASAITVLGSGNSNQFSWSHGSGATLLDYTTPTDPKIITAGIYAVTFFMLHFSGTGSTIEYALIELGVAGSPAVFAADIMPFNYSTFGASKTISRTMHLAANQSIRVNVTNFGSTSRDFSSSGYSITQLA